MRTAEELETSILDIVTRATNQRIRPFELEQTVMLETGASMPEVKNALHQLMSEDSLVFTYRDPCSYVEVPTLESRRSA